VIERRTTVDAYPSYAELQARTDGPPGSAWGVFGADDQIGALNFIDAPTIARAVASVSRGAVFNLDVPLNSILPSRGGGRRLAEHHISKRPGPECDDWLDTFYLQQSSQIDGLRHRGHPDLGFYNGVDPDDIEVGSPTLGIQHWAQRGIVGRGVLLDVARALEPDGVRFTVDGNEPISVQMLERTIAAQGSPLEPGDILLIRTGWLTAYRELDDSARQALTEQLRGPGLEQSVEMVAWLWDHRIGMVAADNPALECYPTVPEAPFPWSPPLLHPILIGLLGMVLGELWDLDALAADCAADRVFHSLLVSKPLNLVGGVGSPANALALK
jgi:kynurenine formamidase